MQRKAHQTNDMTAHDRLTEVAEILARGICRLKQREAQERESGLDEPVTIKEAQKNKSLSNH